LINLKDFYLSGNSIEAFDAIQSVAYLPQLQIFALNNSEFGPNPVCELPGYKNFMMNTIHCSNRSGGKLNLTELDGELLNEDSFQAAQRDYME
jgi:hypothetical protein